MFVLYSDHCVGLNTRQVSLIELRFLKNLEILLVHKMSDKLVGQLEKEALKRKERLAALKSGKTKTLKQVNSEVEGGDDEASEVPELDTENFPKPLFRNYTPADDSLKEAVLPKPDLIELESQIKDQLANAKPVQLIEKEIDLLNLAPQKVDWDLKRDLQKRLNVLEKRTHRAIVQLISERFKEKNDQDDQQDRVRNDSEGNSQEESKDSDTNDQIEKPDEATASVNFDRDFVLSGQISDEDDY